MFDNQVIAAGKKAIKDVGLLLDKENKTHNQVYRKDQQLCNGCPYSGQLRQPNIRYKVLGEIS